MCTFVSNWSNFKNYVFNTFPMTQSPPFLISSMQGFKFDLKFSYYLFDGITISEINNLNLNSHFSPIKIAGYFLSTSKTKHET